MAERRIPILRLGKPKPEDRKPKVVGGGEIRSSYFPGVSDGSWLLPDWVRDPVEQDTDGVWRPKRRT